MNWNKPLHIGRFGIPLLAILLVAMVAVASATVFVFFYSGMTLTVRSPDVTLAAGSDASASCTMYPCATVAISSTSDTARVSLSMFKADTTFTPVPATYYSNLVLINDANNGHVINSIQVFSIGTTGTPFGSVTVYYCTTQTNFNPNGTPVTACTGSYTFTAATSGTVFTGSQGIAVGATQYIELVSYAGSSAASGNTITFTVSISWT